MRTALIISTLALFGLAAAGCDQTREMPKIGPLAPRMAAGPSQPGAESDVPSARITPMRAVEAPVAKVREPGSPTPVPTRPEPGGKGETPAKPAPAERPPVLTPADLGDTPRLVDTVLAEVNGEVITREDILGPLRPQMTTWRKEMSTEAFESRCRQVIELKLRQEISRRLVVQEAKSSLSDDEKKEIDTALGQTVKDMSAEAGSRHALEEKMKKEGLTVKDEESKQRDRMAVQRFLKQKIAPSVHVTHGELLDYYNKVKAERYEQPARSHLALIAIKKGESATPEQAQALARAVHERAVAGEDFAKLAQRYSQDPMAPKGGDWGFVTRGSFRIKAVEDALFSLGTGQVAPVVETPDIYYIVKAIERQEARTVPFTEVQDVVEEEIREKKFNDQTSKYIQELYERSYVRVMMENI